MTDFNQQLKQMFQPSTDLFALNAKVLETAMAQQSKLVNSFISSSLEFNKQMVEQKDLTNVQKLSEDFGKSVTEQITAANKEVVSAITTASEQSTQVVKDLVEQTKQTVTQAAK